MALIADILLIAGALGAAFYCMILSRRLSRFNNLEGGMGGAIAVLSSQVDDMTKSLQKAQEASAASRAALDDVTARAEAAAKRLELMMASLHDLEGSAPRPAAAKPAVDAGTGSETALFQSRRGPANGAVQ